MESHCITQIKPRYKHTAYNKTHREHTLSISLLCLCSHFFSLLLFHLHTGTVLAIGRQHITIYFSIKPVLKRTDLICLIKKLSHVVSTKWWNSGCSTTVSKQIISEAMATNTNITCAWYMVYKVTEYTLCAHSQSAILDFNKIQSTWGDTVTAVTTLIRSHNTSKDGERCDECTLFTTTFLFMLFRLLQKVESCCRRQKEGKQSQTPVLKLRFVLTCTSAPVGKRWRGKWLS